MSLMYFFNSVDRSNLSNAETDGLSEDLGFSKNGYSLLVLLFYVPFGLCDLPLNLLTKRFSGKTMLPTRKQLPTPLTAFIAKTSFGAVMVAWGCMALIQCATKNFGGILAVRLILG
jgi:hypothetical protein